MRYAKVVIYKSFFVEVLEMDQDNDTLILKYASSK